MTAKPMSIKGTGCKFGGCVRKAVELTSRDLPFVPESGLRVERSTLARSGAPRVSAEGTESLAGTRETESLAIGEPLMEEVCEQENCKQALAQDRLQLAALYTLQHRLHAKRRVSWWSRASADTPAAPAARCALAAHR